MSNLLLNWFVEFSILFFIFRSCLFLSNFYSVTLCVFLFPEDICKLVFYVFKHIEFFLSLCLIILEGFELGFYACGFYCFPLMDLFFFLCPFIVDCLY